MFTLFFYCSLTLILIPAAAWSLTLDPTIADNLSKAPQGKEIDVIVRLKPGHGQVAMKAGTADENRHERTSRVVRHLKQAADHSLVSVRPALEKETVSGRIKKVKYFWVFNGFLLTATAEGIKRMAELPEVAEISLNRIVKLGAKTSNATVSTSWNLNQVRAPELWSKGFSGQGTVVATLDTGVDMNHPALASKWRGGANSWFDPHLGMPAPYDVDGHGTAVTGLMVGGNTTDNTVGVAPGAKWIAAKVFDNTGSSDLAKIHSVFQWVLDPDGNPATPDSPDVVNNSWDLDGTAGIYDGEFQSDIDSLRASGIAVVFSAGNQQLGATTGSSTSPGNNQGAFAVGAVDSTGLIGYFSSRGPSPTNGSIYPVLSAPGVNIHSTDLFGTYAGFTGTSYSAPHVSGAIALLKSAIPELTVQQLEDALKFAVVGPNGPDNIYGYGRLDVAKAYAYLTTPGDVNGDGIVNILDVLILLNVSVDGSQSTPLIVRNGAVSPLGVDGKPNRSGGTIGTRDALLILQKALGIVSW